MNLEIIKRVRVFSVCFAGLSFFFFQVPVALFSQVQTGLDEKERPCTEDEIRKDLNFMILAMQGGWTRQH